MGQSQSTSANNLNPHCFISKQSKLSNTSLIAFGRSKWNNHNNWIQQKFDIDKGQVYQSLPMGVIMKYPLIDDNQKYQQSYHQNSQSFLDLQKESNNTKKFILKFLKQLSYTSQQDYQQSYIRNLQKMSQKNDSILTLEDVKTRAQNTFCSTFYKIGLTFQYYQHSLLKQVKLRLMQKREFEQRQVWGVLCACIFAMGHLQRYQGRSHCALLLDDIKLTPDGGVKILSFEMVGHGFYGNQNNNLYRFHNSCLAVLSSTICHLLKFVNTESNFPNLKNTLNSISNQQQLQYLIQKQLNEILDKIKIHNLIINNQQFECSDQIKQILQLMLDENTCILDVQQKIQKLSLSINYQNSDQYNHDQAFSYKNSYSNSSQKSSNQNNNGSNQGTPIVLKNSNSQNLNIGNNSHGNNNNQKYKILKPSSHNRKNSQNISPYESKNYQINKNTKDDYMHPITENNRQSQQSSRYDLNSNNQINQQFQYECPRIVPSQRHSYQNPLNYHLSNDIPDQPSSIFVNDSTQENQQPDQNDLQQDQENNQKNFNQEIQKDLQNHEKITYVTEKLGNVNSNMNININFIKRPQSTTPFSSNNQTQFINNQIMQKQQIKIKNEASTDLFTNPSLLDQIKNDLQEIKMRKSQNNFVNDGSRVSLMNMSQSNLSHNGNLNSNTQRYDLSHANTFNNSNNHIISNSKSLLMNRKESQNIILNAEKLPENPQQKNVSQNSNNFKQITSILEDNTTGFKKKSKSNTKRQNQSENQEEKKCLNNQQAVSKNINLKGYSKQEIKFNQNNYQQQPSVKNLSKYLENQCSSKSLKPLQRQSSNLFFQQNKSQFGEKNLQYSRQTYAKGKYEGTKLNGMRHGHGTFFYSQGGKYVGQWLENRMHGQGVLYYPSNQIAYEGRWQKDQLSGKGILYNEEVSILNTPYDYKNWENVQQFWTKYVGQFLNDNKHGSGILFLSNGQKFQGEFKNDQVDGNGILFRKDGRQIKGLWRKNKLIRLL